MAGRRGVVHQEDAGGMGRQGNDENVDMMLGKRLEAIV